MGIRFIYGRSGSSKSTYCIEEIKSRLEEGVDYPLILLVPEQFSLQAEKNLVAATGRGGIIGCEVLTFRRMAYRVFNEAGGLTKKRLNPAGRSMLIFRVLKKVKKDLKVLSGSASHKGFVKIISELITEFKRHNIAPEELEDVCGKLPDDGFFRQKLREISLIYSEFQKSIEKGYMDLDDDLTYMCKRLNNSVQFDGAEIWIDEFTGFTPQEYSVLEILMQKARNINFSLRTGSLIENNSNDPGNLFSPVLKTINKIVKIANTNKVEIKKPVRLDARPLPRFSNSPELAHLESTLFTYPVVTFSEPVEDIVLFAAKGINSEIESAAKKITGFCREKGLRYRDIAVVTGNLEGYEKNIRNIFELYEIPYFIDSKRSISGHPLVSFVLSALDIYIKNWSYESVFRYLKTGLTNLAPEETDLMENYVLACGIRGNRWTRDEDWDYLPESMYGTDELEDRGALELEKINQIRRKISEPLMSFINSIKGKKAAQDICSALFALLEDTGAAQKTEAYIDYFNSSGQLDLANEYSQIWNILMEMFDQIVEVLGDGIITVEAFREILASGLEEFKIGLVPPSLDQVQVGSIDRSINHNIKALFVLGVNDGLFPAVNKDEGIISDSERNILSGLGLELAEDTRTRTFEENYFVYEILSTPSKFLWLSYPVADEEGRALRPSGIIGMIKRMFPQLVEKSNIIEKPGIEESLELISVPGPTFRELLRKIKSRADGSQIADVWQDAAAWFINNENWSKKFELALSGLTYTNLAGNLERESLHKAIGGTVFTSISRLEKYVNCPFAYFVQYGLKARERKVFRLTPPDVGTFMHNIIDAFSKRIAAQRINWRELTREMCNSMISDIVDTELEKSVGSILKSSKRYFYLVRRLKRIMSRAVRLISEHIRRSGFEPLGYEVSFGYDSSIPPIEIELSNGATVKLTGRIDRIDTMKSEDGTFVRIIDYKSGTKDFKLQDVYYGLQLQLITYLDALTEKGIPGTHEKLLPGGILYFKIDDPIIRSKGDIPKEEVEKAIMKHLRMDGLLLNDVKLVKEMDREMDGSSEIIPVRLNKGDELATSSKVATMEQFIKLRKHARHMLRQISEQIAGGNIAIKPWKSKKAVSCKFCSFSSICRFEASIPGNNYRILYDLKDEDVWEKIKG